MATSAVAVHPTSRLPHAPRPLLLGAIALAGVALGVVELALAIPHDGNDIQIALLLWITLPYIAAGLIAWWRRPDSRLGPLMVAGGFAIGLSALQLADDLTITTVGALFDILPVAIFLHVYLAFPDGRLRSRIERWLVSERKPVNVGVGHFEDWQERFVARAKPLTDVSIGEVLEQALGIAAAKWTKGDQMRVGAFLLARKWVKYRTTTAPREWRYMAPGTPVP